MKKNICILLLALLVLAGFSACGKPTATKIPDNQEPTPTPVVEETTEVPLEGETETPTDADATVAPDATAAPGENATPGAAETTAPGEVSNPAQKPASTTVWKEVPIGKPVSVSMSIEFDLRETILETDFVFSGTIISAKQYDVSWVDDGGNTEGPYERAILEVRITHDYYGRRPTQVKDDIIKVFYPYSLAWVIENSVLVKENTDYVFMARKFTDETVGKMKALSPDNKENPEEHADVWIGSTTYKLMPIDKGRIILHCDYFSHDENAMKKVVPYMLVDPERLSNPERLQNGAYVALNAMDFEAELMKLYADPGKLPGFGG